MQIRAEEHVEHFLTSWGYIALFVATAISTTGIPIGSELAIGYAGALASGQLLTGPNDHLSLGFVIAIATAGEVAGSILGYAIGFLGGRPLVTRLGRYVLVSEADLTRAESWFARHGEPAVFFGRLVPLLRSFISLAAGLTRMRPLRYLALSIPASAIFCAALASAGYALGHSWHHLTKDVSYAGYLALVLALVVIALAIAHRIAALRREH